MAPRKAAATAANKKAKTTTTTTVPSEPPQPFKRAPEALAPFLSTLSPKHVYITHIDNKPTDFKRKIFLIPVVINLAIAVLAVLRIRYIAPWYFQLVTSALGHDNETTLHPATLTWALIAKAALRRAVTFSLDFLLFVFVWPWPVEFCLALSHGNPVRWRWNVGFRDREIYVRRSRAAWDVGIAKKVLAGEGDVQAKGLLLNNVAAATSPMLINEKTGYLTMNGEWDLDWAAMVRATRLVDDKTIALDAFKLVVVLYHEAYGWVALDLKTSETAQDDERRNQVFAFRDALAAVGKEDLFYRWIEIVQFESTQPGGFGPEKQVTVAKKIRDLFAEQGIDFDAFWKESVGSDGLANM